MPQGRKENNQMNSNQKQKKLSRNITVAVAVLIVATLCVTIAAITAAKRSKVDHPSTGTPSGTHSTPEQTVPTQSTTHRTEPTPSATSPTTNTPAVNIIEWSAPASGEIIKNYSADIPVFSLTMEDYRIHSGIDISGNAGDDVLAAADGVIENVYYDPMMGQTVVIKHSDSYSTIYQNLQTIIPEGIEAGAQVKGGEKIGTVGDTALIEISDSPHLHFAVKVDGEYANPLSYVSISTSAGKIEYED